MYLNMFLGNAQTARNGGQCASELVSGCGLLTGSRRFCRFVSALKIPFPGGLSEFRRRCCKKLANHGRRETEFSGQRQKRQKPAATVRDTTRDQIQTAHCPPFRAVCAFPRNIFKYMMRGGPGGLEPPTRPLMSGTPHPESRKILTISVSFGNVPIRLFLFGCCVSFGQSLGQDISVPLPPKAEVRGSNPLGRASGIKYLIQQRSFENGLAST